MRDDVFPGFNQQCKGISRIQPIMVQGCSRWPVVVIGQGVRTMESNIEDLNESRASSQHILQLEVRLLPSRINQDMTMADLTKWNNLAYNIIKQKKTQRTRHSRPSAYLFILHCAKYERNLPKFSSNLEKIKKYTLQIPTSIDFQLYSYFPVKYEHNKDLNLSVSSLPKSL